MATSVGQLQKNIYIKSLRCWDENIEVDVWSYWEKQK